EADDVAATAFLPEIGVEGDLHVGALGNRELLGDDRQGRGVGADVLPETPSEDGLPVGDAGRSLLEKRLKAEPKSRAESDSSGIETSCWRCVAYVRPAAPPPGKLGEGAS